MSRFDVFAVLWSLMTCSFGFTMDRSVAFVPSAWDTAPSLDTYQKIFVNPAVLKNKTQVTGMDKILQTAKMSGNTPENQTREKRSTTENIETEMKLIDKMALAMRNDSSEENADTIIAPRNVILLLIDERNQDENKEGNSWKDYKDRMPFAIEEFLQRCCDKIEGANFYMDSAPASENKEKSCNCEHVLRSNIGDLLSWARQTREMTTGTVSSSNFSIPFFPKFESGGFNESDEKLKLRKSKRDSNDGWQVIDFNDRAKSVTPLITADPKTGGETNYGVMWDIFDMFSKIRTAFFRSLLESLQRNDGTFEDEFSPRRPFSSRPTATNLIGNTIRELKSIPNDKGYMLIAVVPKSEGAAAVNLLQRETSLKDTLLVVTQICTGDERSVPFVAQGPNNRILRETRAIAELPIAIKKAIMSDCHGTGCTNRQRRDAPIVPRMPVEIFSQELPARKRVIINKNAEKPSTVNNEETTVIAKEKQARSSTSLKTIPKFATVLGITTSIHAMAAKPSS